MQHQRIAALQSAEPQPTSPRQRGAAPRESAFAQLGAERLDRLIEMGVVVAALLVGVAALVANLVALLRA